MEHPQPAFDLLTSLPTDTPLDENVFADWWARDAIDAEKGDDIASHPEIWQWLELPPVLAELSPGDFVTLQPYHDGLNLNAIAIGLGLEDVQYEPAQFAGLVYNPEEHDATAILFSEDILLAVGDTEQATTDTVTHTLDRLETLGLQVGAELDSMQSGRVTDFI